MRNIHMSDEEVVKCLQLIEEIDMLYPLVTAKMCCACAGTGRYDSTGSPKCGACVGYGNEPTDDDTYWRLRTLVLELSDIDHEEASLASGKVVQHMETIGVSWTVIV